ncbi:MAG TPA: thioredoxin-disulfide reductase [Candidatus Babeliales bacterium]|nr:thioredoxin-disulfide reductase [Candidatus Babeliales bacterium]
MDDVRKLIIIGSGPAGLTAGIYATRANLKPIIFEGKEPGGQLMGTTYVENWPGEKKILGPTLMANMRDHAQHLGCTFVSEEIVKVDFSKRPFSVWTNKDKEFKSHSVIIATGTSPKKLGIPGEKEYWGKGVTTCAVCDGAFYPDKEVIIVGGGDTAMEDASFMTKFTDKITIVHILDSLTACHAMQHRVLDNPKIKILYNSTLKEIKGDNNHVTETVIEDQKTGQKKTVPVDAIFIAIGLKPNIKPFENQLELTSYGYIKVTGLTKTSVEGVFAAGDVADDKYKQAITSAGTGCMAALDAERYLASAKLI